MARVSKVMETQKRELKLQLRETRYADPHVHVAAASLEKLELRVLEEN